MKTLSSNKSKSPSRNSRYTAPNDLDQRGYQSAKYSQSGKSAISYKSPATTYAAHRPNANKDIVDFYNTTTDKDLKKFGGANNYGLTDLAGKTQQLLRPNFKRFDYISQTQKQSPASKKYRKSDDLYPHSQS